MPSRQPVVLLTCFGPFGADPRNPSRDIAVALDGRVIGGHRVVSRELPVVFGQSLDALREAIARTRPALVVCLGLAASRSVISLERVAINIDDARIADNAGQQPVDAPVVAGGPAAYFSTLPVKAMLQALQEAGHPCEVSQTAGTYVCNHVFYGLMHALRRRRTLRGGFIHVPHAADGSPVTGGGAQAPTLEGMTGAIALAIATALAHQDDLVLAAGRED